MIRVRPVARPELRVLGAAPARPPPVPHEPRAVGSAFLQKHARPLAAIGKRFGVDATSSLAAALEAAAGAHNLGPFGGPEHLFLVLRDFGPLGWVETGNTFLRPSIPACWFAFDGAWHNLPVVDGVQRAIRAAPDACLAAPRDVLGAVTAATHARFFDTPTDVLAAAPSAPPAVCALAQPPSVVGRTVHAVALYQGSLGPLVLDVDRGEATLETALSLPWAPGAQK